jgi:hypothetical protein
MCSGADVQSGRGGPANSSRTRWVPTLAPAQPDAAGPGHGLAKLGQLVSPVRGMSGLHVGQPRKHLA